jgi:DNA-binding MarR family transcriptional regulator
MSVGRSSEGEAATKVILATFRANGLLLAAGDLLAADEDLTSARWQVLGAIALAERPLTVPQVARRMGLTRQSVHATVRRLVGDGLAAYETNEDHRRSPLVRLTPVGTEKFRTMQRRQAGWVNRLAAGFSAEDLETTARVLGDLSRTLEAASRRDAGAEP